MLAAFYEAKCFTTVVATCGGGHWATRFLQNCHELVITQYPSLNAAEIRDISWQAPRHIVSAHYDPSIAWALTANTDAALYAHFHTEPEYGLFTLDALRRAGEHCESVFFPSSATAAHYGSLLEPAPLWWATKAVVLPNGSPSSTGSGGSDFRRPNQRGLHLGIVSRLDPDKLDVDLLVDSLLLLREREPDLVVRVAGDGLIGQDVREQLKKHGLLDIVTLHGWLMDPTDVYRWADVTYLPSHVEAMPYAALESIAGGVPVALPSIGHFSDGDCDALAFTFTRGDPESAVVAIGAAQRSRRLTPTRDSHRSLLEPPRWHSTVTAAYGLKI